MSRTRKLATVLTATAVLSLTGGASASARPVNEQPDLSGTLTDALLLDAVRSVSPWLVR